MNGELREAGKGSENRIRDRKKWDKGYSGIRWRSKDSQQRQHNEDALRQLRTSEPDERPE